MIKLWKAWQEIRYNFGQECKELDRKLEQVLVIWRCSTVVEFCVVFVLKGFKGSFF